MQPTIRLRLLAGPCITFITAYSQREIEHAHKDVTRPMHMGG